MSLGTNIITIRKANAKQDSEVAGWISSYGTPQAVFSGGSSNVWNFTQGYYLINGVTGSGDNGSSYGIKVTYSSACNTYNPMVTINSHVRLTKIWLKGAGYKADCDPDYRGISDKYRSNVLVDHSLVQDFISYTRP